MKQSLLFGSVGFCLLLSTAQVSQAQTEVTTLYDGVGTPADHGWTLHTGAGHLGGSVTETFIPSNSLEVETTRMRFHSWSFDTGHAEFLVSARMRITHAQYNFADAGLIFSVLGEAGKPDRFSGIYLTPDHVGFMDLKGMAPIAAEQYHDFTILFRDNALGFYVDDSFESILNGTAVPEMYRPDPIPSFFGNTMGVIQIGDQSNDFRVNSRFRLESISFIGITPIPEPGTSLTLSVGLAWLAWAASRKRSSGPIFKRVNYA
jgi:hypothetical protein